MIVTVILQQPEGEEWQHFRFELHRGTRQVLLKLISHVSSLCQVTLLFAEVLRLSMYLLLHHLRGSSRRN